MTESIPTTLRTRAQIDQEFQFLCMINGDKAFKIELLKAEIQKNELRLAQLTQEPAQPPTPTPPVEDPVIPKVAAQVTELGKQKKTKKTTNSVHQ